MDSLATTLVIKMADEHNEEDESNLNQTNQQNGQSLSNDTNHLGEAGYSSDEGIAIDDGETCGRTNSFYERAFAESQRMNTCINESQEIQARLREEFGSDILSEWLQEHLLEIFSPTTNDCLQAQVAHHGATESVARSDT